MRRRLVVSTALIALATVLLLGIPLAFVEANRERADAGARLEREADAVAAAVDDQVERGRPVVASSSLRELVRRGHEVVVRPSQGPVVVLGTPVKGRRISAGSGAAGPVRVTASVSASEVDAAVRRRWLLIALLAAGAVGAAVLLALVQARRLSRPLEQLALTSTLLGEGDFSARAGRSAIEEIDAVAVALDATAVRIAQLVGREREFTVNAAHQLRTPLTALRLRLEEIEAQRPPGLEQETARALHEVDRLQATVDDLLTLAREGRTGDARPLDLGALIRTHVTRWRPLFDRAGRRVVVADGHGVTPLASRGAIGQALDVLVDNALRHGGGTVRIAVESRDGRAVLSVSDEGPGVTPGSERMIFQRGGSAAGGTGIGLHLARSLVEAENARLRVATGRPSTFEIVFPSD